MWTLYLVSKRLPRVCMGGSILPQHRPITHRSAPRVHGWFLYRDVELEPGEVCPACAWVVPHVTKSYARTMASAPRVHGWFHQQW